MNTFDASQLQRLRRKEKEGTLTPKEAKELKRLLKMLTGPPEDKALHGSENK